MHLSADQATWARLGINKITLAQIGRVTGLGRYLFAFALCFLGALANGPLVAQVSIPQPHPFPAEQPFTNGTTRALTIIRTAPVGFLFWQRTIAPQCGRCTDRSRVPTSGVTADTDLLFLDHFHG